MRVRRVLSSLSTVVLLTGGSSGCDKVIQKLQQKAVEKAVEKTQAKSAEQVQVDVDSKRLSAVSKNGKQVTAVGEKAKLPDNFPKRVPIYPGAELTVSHSDQSEAPRYAVMYKVGEPSDKVIAYYKNELKGFKLDQETAGELGRAFLFTDKSESKLRLQVVVGRDGDDARSVVMLSIDTLR